MSKPLRFDRDIAEKVGVNAALVIKYVECAVRGKLDKKGGPWVWHTLEEIAERTGLTEDQVRTAVKKAKKAGILRVRRNQHFDHTNRVNNYCFDVDAFFPEREGAKKMCMWREDFVAHGACAAVLLYSFEFWMQQNNAQAGNEADHDGRVWHHDSLGTLAKVYKGLFTRRQIEDVANRLVKEGILLRRPCGNSRTQRWFSVLRQHQKPNENGVSAEISGPKIPLSESQKISGREIPLTVRQIPLTGREIPLPYTYSNPPIVPLAAARLTPSQPSNTTLRERESASPPVADAPVVKSTAHLANASGNSVSFSDREGNEPEKEKALPEGDREWNARETYNRVHQEVFGCPPAYSLGRAREALLSAKDLGLSMEDFCFICMKSWSLSQPHKPFVAR
jgi:hypothetical protein